MSSYADNDSEIFSVDDQSINAETNVSDEISEDSETESMDNLSLNDKVSLNLNKKYEIISNVNTYTNYYKNTKVSTPYLTKYEKAKLLGVRAQMISNGSPALINVPKHIKSSYEIAKLEFEEDKIPLLIRRFLPNGSYEDWRLEDMMIK